MNLDILTPKGQKTLIQEQRLLEIASSHLSRTVSYPVSNIETPKARAAKCDGFFVNPDNEIVALYECKCRTLTEQDLIKFDSAILTEEKLIQCCVLSTYLCVPFLFLFYLVPDDIAYYWKMTDEKGQILVPYTVEETRTQRTVNGGSAVRKNAYLPVKFAIKMNPLPF